MNINKTSIPVVISIMPSHQICKISRSTTDHNQYSVSHISSNHQLTLELVTASILGDTSSVEEKVLRIRNDGRNQGHGHETQDGTPAGVVKRGVALAEELAADDARCVCGHDEDGHGDGSFTGGSGVEGHPGAIDRV